MKKDSLPIFSLWKKYKFFLYLNILIILVLSVTTDLAAAGSITGSSLTDNPQKVTVKGVVADSGTGGELAGVNVSVKGITFGAITDVYGKYSLDVPVASSTLLFSFIGYVNQEIALNGRTSLNVVLASNVSELGEVVVIGYGTAKKATVTGSIKCS